MYTFVWNNDISCILCWEQSTIFMHSAIFWSFPRYLDTIWEHVEAILAVLWPCYTCFGFVLRSSIRWKVMSVNQTLRMFMWNVNPWLIFLLIQQHTCCKYSNLDALRCQKVKLSLANLNEIPVFLMCSWCIFKCIYILMHTISLLCSWCFQIWRSSTQSRFSRFCCTQRQIQILLFALLFMLSWGHLRLSWNHLGYLRALWNHLGDTCWNKRCSSQK